MNDFFSLIGTLASIGSIPLSIYFYLKSRENKFDSIKRSIVKILSHQIGDRRVLTTFEIQTVINSITREHRVENDKISVDQIIEDLVAETISNPLLDKDIKEKIISELKKIYYKGELLEKIEEIEFAKSNTEGLETELKQILQKNRAVYEEELNTVKNRTSKLSEMFAIIASATTLSAAIFILLGKEKSEKLLIHNDIIYGFLKENDFYIGLIVSIVTAVFSSVLLLLIKKRNEHKKKE
ncbi:MAG: hypothetical protein IPQ02_16135 [Saprospiraceae bacterium]|nr:hypothetical protein [Candidatus Defluviibacterium haderslevense]